MPTGWVAALEEEGSMLSNQVTGEDSEFKVEAAGGISVHLAQPVGGAAMFHVWVPGPFCLRLPPP